jgi:predicted membrane-bound dolichyl-phosphate-mannose-protein mannosyltransferase
VAAPEPAVTALPVRGRSEAVARWIHARADALGLKGDLTLLALLFVGALLRAFRLGRPTTASIQDEQYYVQDARVILGLPVNNDHLPARVLSGLDPNSEHPPLAKLLMAASMHVLGPSAIAWRMPSVLFGVLSIWLIYRLVRAVGGTTKEARVAAFVMTFDNLAIVHGRIGTLDISVMTFMLLGTLLYVSGAFELAGVALGLATLCKLNGLFGVGAIALFELLRTWRNPREHEARGLLAPLSLLVGFYSLFTLTALGALDRGWTEFRQPWDHIAHIVRFGASLRRPLGMQGTESTPLQWWLNQVPIDYFRVQTTVNDVSRVTVLFRGAMTEYVISAAPFALAFAAWRTWRGSSLGALALALFAANYGPLVFAWLLASRTSYIYYALQVMPSFAVAIASSSPPQGRSSAGASSSRWGRQRRPRFPFTGARVAWRDDCTYLHTTTITPPSGVVVISHHNLNA